MAIVNTFTSKVRIGCIDLALSCVFRKLYIHFVVPAPHSLTLTSTPASPIRPIGTNVTLKCTAELSPLVDVPVTVNVQLTDPSGSPLITTPPAVSGSTYTTIAIISSFGRNQSGDYICTATLISVSLFLTNSQPQTAVNNVTVGKNIMCNLVLAKIYPDCRNILVLERECHQEQ